MKFVPTLEDYLKHLTLPAWIHNGVKDVENPMATQFATDLIAKLQEEEEEQLTK
jgi:2-keto-3-deoxy-6-phosphogluconate aldolase